MRIQKHISFPELKPEQILAMREWAADCQWLDNDSLDEYPDATIILGIERHYDGGVDGFLRDGFDGPIPSPARPGEAEAALRERGGKCA